MTEAYPEPVVSRLSVPTTAGYDGPFLVESAQLIALDKLFDEYETKFRGAVNEHLEQMTTEDVDDELTKRALDPNEVEERRAYWMAHHRKYSGKEKRLVIVYLSGGRKIESGRFSGIVSSPHMEQELPLSFRYSIKSGDFECNVELPKSYGPELSIECAPNRSQLTHEFFGALQNWASDIRPPDWLTRWSKLRSAVGFVLYMWSVTALLVVLQIGFANTSTSDYKTQAHELLSSGGVNAANQQRAFELLLAIASEYQPRDTGFVMHWSVLRYATFGILVLACLYTSPRSVLGVWRGKKRLSRWRLWIRIASVTIPGLVIGSIVWPFILRLLK